MNKHLKTAASLLCSSALALGMLGTAPLRALADETGRLGEGPVVNWVYRLSGDYANQTAAVVADQADIIASDSYHYSGCDSVVLARDDDFRDAMSAAGLAGALECPILLTSRDGLSEAAADEIRELGAESAYVIGGPGAMPGDFESELDELGCAVERVYGDASYDTSVECAKIIAGLGGSDEDAAVVAYGQNFQDALSMSSFAYAHKVPIFLQTFGDTSAERGLTAEAVGLIESSFGGALYVAGGEGAVSSASLAGLSAFASGDFERLWGEDGYDTSLAIAEHMVENGLLNAYSVVVASGALQAKGLDALAGAALAGGLDAPVLLANGQAAFGAVDTSAVEGFLAKHRVKEAYVLGGAYVMPDETVMGALKPGVVANRTYGSGGFFYGAESGEAAVMGYARGASSLEIPSTIDGLPVTSIAEGAFRLCTSLESVTIPSGVASIGYGAFDGCTSLESVFIPSGVASIGDYAFASCDSLESVFIPSSVASIGDGVFDYCDSLERIDVAAGNPAYKSVDGVLFSADGSELLRFPGARAGSYEIPSGVASIGDCAFSGCSSLEGVIIPEGVTSIGRSVFEDCSSLENVIIPSGVASIGDYAFASCSSLMSVTVPSSVASIGRGAFWGMADPSTVYVSTQAHYDLLNGNSDYIYTGRTKVKLLS